MQQALHKSRSLHHKNTLQRYTTQQTSLALARATVQALSDAALIAQRRASSLVAPYPWRCLTGTCHKNMQCTMQMFLLRMPRGNACARHGKAAAPYSQGCFNPHSAETHREGHFGWCACACGGWLSPRRPAHPSTWAPCCKCKLNFRRLVTQASSSCSA